MLVELGLTAQPSYKMGHATTPTQCLLIALMLPIATTRGRVRPKEPVTLQAQLCLPPQIQGEMVAHILQLPVLQEHQALLQAQASHKQAQAPPPQAPQLLPPSPQTQVPQGVLQVCWEDLDPQALPAA